MQSRFGLASSIKTTRFDVGTELLTITGSVFARVVGVLGLSGITSPFNFVPNLVVSSIEASIPEYLFCVASADALLSGISGKLYCASGTDRGVEANVAGWDSSLPASGVSAGSGDGGGVVSFSELEPLVQAAPDAALLSHCRPSFVDLVAVTFVFSSPSEAESEDNGSSEKMPESS